MREHDCQHGPQSVHPSQHSEKTLLRTCGDGYAAGRMDAVGSSLKTVLVAGATGALGRHVVRELVARGHRVCALTRRSEGANLLALPPEAIVRADALDARSLEGCCHGIDVVFSCVGASVSP